MDVVVGGGGFGWEVDIGSESKDRAVESELSFKRETEPWRLRPRNMGM